MKAKNPEVPSEPTALTPGEAAPAVAYQKSRLLCPVALNAPRLDRDLPALPAIERSAEVLRFSLARLEYWLSPGGSLRACLRLGLWIWCVAGLFGVFVAPAVTCLLTEAVTWSNLLTQLIHNLMLLPLGIGTFLLSLAGVLFVFRFLFRR